jgi:hypothetical protein
VNYIRKGERLKTPERHFKNSLKNFASDCKIYWKTNHQRIGAVQHFTVS